MNNFIAMEWGGLAFHQSTSTWWSWTVGIVLVMGVWLWWSSRREPGIPGPRSYPVIGCTLELVHNWDRLHDWMLAYFSNEDRSYRITFAFPNVPAIYTVDPANVEHILKINFSNYPKGLSNCTPMRELFGVGIFTTDGEMWKEQRRVASYEFSSAVLRDFSAVVFRENACKLGGIVRQLACGGQAFDLHDLCMRMTLDTTCSIGFGVQLECLSLPLRTIPFAQCFDEVNCISYHRFSDPLWKLKRWLNVGLERRLKHSVRVLDDFSFHVIQQRRNQMAAGTVPGCMEHQSDLLSRFIELHKHDKGGEGLKTDKVVRDMILNFIIAGRDTTAVTLSWFFYMITQHPHVGDKIVHELATVVAPQHSTGVQEHDKEWPKEEVMTEFAKMLAYETVEKLHYLHASLSETLRLYPAVPVDNKEAAADDVLPDSTIVKKGMIIGFVPYSMGRMPFLWGPDAHLFNPERWLDPNGHFQPQPLFKFTAFQAGPRTCLGKGSAYLQMKITAALVLRFFRFQVVPCHLVHYRTMLVLSMLHGLNVTASPR